MRSYFKTLAKAKPSVVLFLLALSSKGKCSQAIARIPDQLGLRSKTLSQKNHVHTLYLFILKEVKEERGN